MRAIFIEALHKPQVISTDNGLEFKGVVPEYLEFKGVVSDYLELKGIIQHFRSVGDINALGIVDRAIQQLRLKLAELMARSESSTWHDVVPKAVLAMNNQRRMDVLHGARPQQVRQNQEVRFMLLEDQAANAVHN